MLLGWLRAILLQLAHPLIAAGVAGHSSFRGSTMQALARLHHTVGAMLALTFGTPREYEQAIEGIRAIHRRVHGVLPVSCGPFPAGTRYSAEDPALLAWVHATLVESIVLVYERLIAPLSPAERDRFCADSADLAVTLGARAAVVPRSWAALRTFMEERYASGDIVVGDQARRLLASIVSPPLAPLLAAGLLPPVIRSQYRVPWNRRRTRRFNALMSLLHAARRVTPRRAAFWKAARSVDCYGGSHGYSTAS